MKTISRLFAAVAAIAALAACNKEVADTGNLPESFKNMTLTVNSGATKVYMLDDETGDLNWNTGDELAVIFEGDSHAYKFVRPYGSGMYDIVFQNADNEPIPAGYEFADITDVYYPYLSDAADYYEDLRVPTTQDCLIPDGDYGYTTDRFEILPMHWEPYYGATPGDNTIKMYADRTAMIKVSKDDYVLNGDSVTVIVDDSSDHKETYTINNVSAENDLIFLIDLGEEYNKSSYKQFIVNGTVMHTRYEEPMRGPLPVYASLYENGTGKNRYRLHPYLYMDFLNEEYMLVYDGDQSITWGDAINNGIVPEELGYSINEGMIYNEEQGGCYLVYEDSYEPILATDLFSAADSRHLTQDWF